MHGDDGADGLDAARVERVAGVEHVPGAGGTGVGGDTVDGDEAGERRVESGQTHGGKGGAEGGDPPQASSSMPVFSPEPTPISRTRSPRRNVFCSAARVMGMDAGPTLPRVG